MNEIFKEGDRVIVLGKKPGEIRGFTVYEDQSVLYHVLLDEGGCYAYPASLLNFEEESRG